MKLLAFTVYDEKAEAFGHPFFLSAVGLATRLFTEWINNPNTPTGKHPGDFKLYQVGTWNDGDAIFETLPVPLHIGNGNDYREEKNEQPSRPTELLSGGLHRRQN